MYAFPFAVNKDLYSTYMDLSIFHVSKNISWFLLLLGKKVAQKEVIIFLSSSERK